MLLPTLAVLPILAALALPALADETLTGRTHVIDGDTIVVVASTSG
jgi:hypothetical protein